MDFAIIFIGAGIGGVLRHAVGLAALRWLGPRFPYGTLTVNLLGSLAMGLLIGILAARNLPGQSLRLFLATGMLGGFTTFSTFALDSVTLWERGEILTAAVYVLTSVIASLLALYAGLMLMRGWGG